MLPPPGFARTDYLGAKVVLRGFFVRLAEGLIRRQTADGARCLVNRVVGKEGRVMGGI
jgi:hypothetical protein